MRSGLSILFTLGVVAGAILATGTASASDTWDKEGTEMALKRAARQVKEHCGAAKDTTGKAPGPWGVTKVSVTLGHNGHSKGGTLPPPFENTPTGRCALQAFSNLTFPPWAGADVVVDWEIELVQPAAENAKK